jgi:ABC-type multidrug transport system ATPase subunit
MEEADTLCNRIAIMINGNLACIGTSQELKSHYGQGYSLVANMEDMSCQDQLTKLLKSIVPHTHIVELYGNQIKYSIPSNDFSLATMFSALQRDRLKLKIDDYSLTQTTLESLFIDLAKRQIVRRWTQVSPFNT